VTKGGGKELGGFCDTGGSFEGFKLIKEVKLRTGSFIMYCTWLCVLYTGCYSRYLSYPPLQSGFSGVLQGGNFSAQATCLVF